jgi:hypothetical protein
LIDLEIVAASQTFWAVENLE